MNYLRFFMIIACSYTSYATAIDLSLSPYLHLEAAAFKDDSNAYTQDQVLSFIPGNKLELTTSHFSLYSNLAYRYDSIDAKRDIWYFGENIASLRDEEGNIILTAGLQRVQLGSLDVFQSVDIINDAISDTYSPDINRQGYPIASLKLFTDSSKFSFYYIPYFFRPYYPPNSARMGFGLEFDQNLLVNSDGKFYKSGRQYPQYGFKFDHSTENIDISLSYFHLADRSLSFTFVDPSLLLTRYFFETDAFIMSLEGNFASLILKANLLFRNYGATSFLVNDQSLGTITKASPHDHSIASFGAETKWQLIKGHDTTWIMEYQKLLGATEEITDRYSIFANDLAWGIRHQFNDMHNKQLLLVHIIDLNATEEQILQLDYRQNINDNFKWGLGTRLIQAKQRADNSLGFDNLNGLTLVDDADTIYTTLSYIY